MKRLQPFLPYAPLAAGVVLWTVGQLLNLDRWWYGLIAWSLLTGYGTRFLVMRFAAPYTLPLEPTGEASSKARSVVDKYLAGREPLMAVIREGKIASGLEGKSRTKPTVAGAIVVDSTSAALISTDTQHLRVVGPGVHFTRDEEKISQALDLRPQFRADTVQAQTRDGIGVGAKLKVRFQIDKIKVRTMEELRKTGERWPEPYTWSRGQVWSVLTRQRAAADPKQIVNWDEVVFNETAKRLQTLVAGYTLDGLTEPRDTTKNPRKDIVEKMEEEVKAALDGSGIRVISISLDPFVPLDEDVRKQRIKAWQADWISRQKSLEAEGVAESYRLIELARAQGQMELVLRIAQALEASQQVGAGDSEEIAVRLLDVVQRLALEPEIDERAAGEGRESSKTA